MSAITDKGKRSADYRRGTVMGLTVAEAFILLAFILLLLLALWRVTERRRYDAALDGCTDLNHLTSEQLGCFKAVLETGELCKTAHTNKALAEGARLVQAEDLKKLIQQVEGLPPTERKAFTELISADGYEQVIDWTHKLAGLIERGRAPEEVTQALALVDALSQDELRDIEALKQKIRQRIEDGDSLGRRVAGAVGRAVGDVVATVGGDIDPASGAVTLPDTALFAQGSAALSVETRGFLNQFCEPWLETLSQFGSQIGALRIEGHASTEWSLRVGAEVAFLNNMDLSQRRASAVLEFCLRRLTDDERRTWAQSRLVAVGFSSAKPIIENGQENPERSRRVVFRSEVDREQIIRDIQKELSLAPALAPSRY